MPDHLRGTINDEFTLNLDLAPTLLSAAGVTVPQHMQGRDIADLYLGDYEKNRKEWRKDFFYEWSQGRADDGEGHKSENTIPAVFALVRKDYKVRKELGFFLDLKDSRRVLLRTIWMDLTPWIRSPVLLLAEEKLRAAVPHRVGPARGARRAQHHRPVDPSRDQGPVRVPQEPEPERAPRVRAVSVRVTAGDPRPRRSHGTGTFEAGPVRQLQPNAHKRTIKYAR
jgi:hypothetical protein